MLTTSTLEGVVNKLIHEADAPAGNPALKLVFPGRIEIPCTGGRESRTTIDGEWWSSEQRTDTARVSALGHRFLFLMEEDELHLHIEPEGETLSAHIAARAVEALQFVLGRIMNWVHCEKHEGRLTRTEVRPFTSSEMTRRHPPLVYNRITNVGDVWEMFRLYAEYIGEREEESWHPLSERIHSVLLASMGSDEAYARALAIEIEGVLDEEYTELGQLDETDEVDRQHAREIIQDAKLKDRTKARVLGAIGSMAKPRAEDRLRSLVRVRAISDSQRLAWNRLRHACPWSGMPT